MHDNKRLGQDMKRLATAGFLILAIMQSSVAYADLKAADRRLNNLYSR